MCIGKIVRQCRLEQGLSYYKLAAKAKMPPTTIEAIEKGDSKRPSFESICKLADALGKRLEDFRC